MSTFNRILSAILALALLLGGLLLAVEVVLTLLGRPPWIVPHEQWSSWLGEQTWQATIIRVVLAGLAVVGLLLLLAGLRRGKPKTLLLSDRTDRTPADVRVTVGRRTLEKGLATATRRTGGVSSATAKVRRRRAKVSAQTSLRSPGDLQQRVASTVTERLTELGLAKRLRTRVRINRREA